MTLLVCRVFTGSMVEVFFFKTIAWVKKKTTDENSLLISHGVLRRSFILYSSNENHPGCFEGTSPMHCIYIAVQGTSPVAVLCEPVHVRPSADRCEYNIFSVVGTISSVAMFD